MLIYDQSLDPYHCAVRAMGIASLLDKDAIEIEALRIIDILLTFPAMLSEVTLPREMISLRKLRMASANPFRPPPKGIAAIEAIRSIQAVAIATLASAEVISAEQLEKGLFARTKHAIPAQLESAVNSWLSRDEDDKKQIVTAMSSIPLLGTDGLKHRTKLLEYRYDPT